MSSPQGSGSEQSSMDDRFKPLHSGCSYYFRRHLKVQVGLVAVIEERQT
jgi:hypothetical protein